MVYYFLELPTAHADFREIKGRDDAFGGRRILRQIVVRGHLLHHRRAHAGS